MTQQINGFVELPAEYVYEMAFGAMKLIERQREKNRQNGIQQVMFNVPFRKFRQRWGIELQTH